MKRERMLTIRVTDDEHARLLERCEGKQLAVWMRRVCLGEPVARSGKLPTLAPPLLRQLAAIGNNLNQTARKVNSALVAVAAAAIKKACSEKKHNELFL